MQRLLKTISTGLARGRLTVAKSASGGFAPVIPQSTAQLAAMPVAAPVPPVAVEVDQSLLGDISLDQPLREARDAFERVYFEYHLARENNSMTRVSDKTGLERTHLYRKLKQLGIEARKRGS